MKIIKELRRRSNVTQDKLAEILGVGRSTVSMWEIDASQPDQELINKLADYFNVTTDYLLGRANTPEAQKSAPEGALEVLRIPVLGTIPAGIPIEAIEDILGEEEVPADWNRGGREYFALRIRGDSMSPNYLSGDTVIFQKAETCDSGTDCCVMINGYDATFKRIYINERGVTLQPLNSSYEAMFYTNAEVEEMPVVVLGVVKELRRSL